MLHVGIEPFASLQEGRPDTPRDRRSVPPREPRTDAAGDPRDGRRESRPPPRRSQPRFPIRSHARVVFAASWVLGQAALVVTGPLRADHIFAFRMFPEASTLEIRLIREVRGQRLPIPHGDWTAADRAGIPHAFSWKDRVRDPVLATLDTRTFASYGADAQLARLSRALDDVADHIQEDAETRRLGAEVTLWRNGHEPVRLTLFSHARPDP